MSSDTFKIIQTDMDDSGNTKRLDYDLGKICHPANYVQSSVTKKFGLEISYPPCNEVLFSLWRNTVAL